VPVVSRSTNENQTHPRPAGEGGWAVRGERKCIVCRERRAEVPDRNRTQGSRMLPKAVCGQCHAKRLLDDLRRVVKQQDKRRDEQKDSTRERRAEG